MELYINSPAYFSAHYGVDDEVYEAGAWKECCSWRCHNSAVAINIRMDFESYYHADSEEKVRLTREMILKAVKKVKSKGKFDYERFVEDFKLVE